MALGKILCVLFTRYKHNKSFRLPVSGLVVSIGSTPTKKQTQCLGEDFVQGAYHLHQIQQMEV